MTKERLEQYRSLKAEIKEIKYKLDHVGEGDSLIGNDVINDYRTGYPRPQSVVGFDWETYKIRERRYTELKEKAEKECVEIAQFIDSIQDSLTRRIFRLRYVEGMTIFKIGMRVYLDKSNVSRRIDDYLKSATYATNATVQ